MIHQKEFTSLSSLITASRSFGLFETFAPKKPFSTNCVRLLYRLLLQPVNIYLSLFEHATHWHSTAEHVSLSSDPACTQSL
mmetsp:Transcript_13079/g.13221  ORF Transcript_13079/g.13221 Transcript_13079/m.13221 type:complete len:81 (+) Transcript_13079:302-544(+)